MERQLMGLILLIGGSWLIMDDLHPKGTRILYKTLTKVMEGVETA